MGVADAEVATKAKQTVHDLEAIFAKDLLSWLGTALNPALSAADATVEQQLCAVAESLCYLPQGNQPHMRRFVAKRNGIALSGAIDIAVEFLGPSLSSASVTVTSPQPASASASASQPTPRSPSALLATLRVAALECAVRFCRLALNTTLVTTPDGTREGANLLCSADAAALAGSLIKSLASTPADLCEAADKIGREAILGKTAARAAEKAAKAAAKTKKAKGKGSKRGNSNDCRHDDSDADGGAAPKAEAKAADDADAAAAAEAMTPDRIATFLRKQCQSLSADSVMTLLTVLAGALPAAAESSASNNNNNNKSGSNDADRKAKSAKSGKSKADAGASAPTVEGNASCSVHEAAVSACERDWACAMLALLFPGVTANDLSLAVLQQPLPKSCIYQLVKPQLGPRSRSGPGAGVEGVDVDDVIEYDLNDGDSGSQSDNGDDDDGVVRGKLKSLQKSSKTLGSRTSELNLSYAVFLAHSKFIEGVFSTFTRPKKASPQPAGENEEEEKESWVTVGRQLITAAVADLKLLARTHAEVTSSVGVDAGVSNKATVGESGDDEDKNETVVETATGSAPIPSTAKPGNESNKAHGDDDDDSDLEMERVDVSAGNNVNAAEAGGSAKRASGVPALAALALWMHHCVPAAAAAVVAAAGAAGAPADGAKALDAGIGKAGKNSSKAAQKAAKAAEDAAKAAIEAEAASVVRILETRIAVFSGLLALLLTPAKQDKSGDARSPRVSPANEDDRDDFLGAAALTPHTRASLQLLRRFFDPLLLPFTLSRAATAAEAAAMNADNAQCSDEDKAMVAAIANSDVDAVTLAAGAFCAFAPLLLPTAATSANAISASPSSSSSLARSLAVTVTAEGNLALGGGPNAGLALSAEDAAFVISLDLDSQSHGVTDGSSSSSSSSRRRRRAHSTTSRKFANVVAVAASRRRAIMLRWLSPDNVNAGSLWAAHFAPVSAAAAASGKAPKTVSALLPLASSPFTTVYVAMADNPAAAAASAGVTVSAPVAHALLLPQSVAACLVALASTSNFAAAAASRARAASPGALAIVTLLGGDSELRSVANAAVTLAAVSPAALLSDKTVRNHK